MKKNTIKNLRISGLSNSNNQLIDIERDDEKAVISHYLQNINNGISPHFEEDEINLLNFFLKDQTKGESSSNSSEELRQQLTFEVTNVPFSPPDKHKFTFIDLFAGIGGFRIALQNLGGKCVYTSEWNKEAKLTYFVNYGEVPFDDITKEKNKNFIPEKFDVLCAGFPCQAFSIAGYRKGFSDTRGTLFFDIEQIVEKHKPKVVFLENVKNLLSHDNGNTFRTILEILEKKLGYKVFYKVLNSSTHANIPQNRERIFIVGFDPIEVKNYSKFEFPQSIELTKTIHDCIDKGKQSDIYYYKKDHRYYPELEKAMVSKNTVYQWRRVYARENKSNLCPTLTANMGAGGHNVPLILDEYGIRKLTPKECFAFQGYPMDKFVIPLISNSKLYMQAGNSVTTPLIERIFGQIQNVLEL